MTLFYTFFNDVLDTPILVILYLLIGMSIFNDVNE